MAEISRNTRAKRPVEVSTQRAFALTDSSHPTLKGDGPLSV